MVVSCNTNFDASVPPCPLPVALPFHLPRPASLFFIIFLVPPCLAFCSFLSFSFFFACVASWLDIDLAIALHCHCLYVCKMEYVEIGKKMGQSSFAGRGWGSVFFSHRRAFLISCKFAL
jgi:hypothetical protein